MARIYFDTNILVDLVGEGKYGFETMVKGSEVVISVLSMHIMAYILKAKIPNKRLKVLAETMETVDFSRAIMTKALEGPTGDFEDNIQLHSAVSGDCDYFLTLDKKLLKMKYFGKMKISDKI